MNLKKRFEIFTKKVVPHLQKHVHYDDMPKNDVSELLSENSKTPAGNQLAQTCRDLIKALRDGQNEFANEELADALENLHKSVRKPRGKRKENSFTKAEMEDTLNMLKEELSI